MDRNPTFRIACCALALLMLCVIARADAGRQAPQFAIRTLNGEYFTNNSLDGNVVLLQFWATWCQYCRRDQPAVDNIEREFASKGVVVLAVDVGEAEQKVRRYLDASPRACRIAIDEDESLARRFGAHGFPFYLVIDREGNIAGTQSGAGGEGSLRNLVSRAFSDGNRPHRNPPATTSVENVSPIEIPRARSAPSKPQPPAVFVLANGERIESSRYLIAGGSLQVEAAGQRRTISLSALDLKATMAENRKRGIELKIPAQRNEVTLSF